MSTIQFTVDLDRKETLDTLQRNRQKHLEAFCEMQIEFLRKATIDVERIRDKVARAHATLTPNNVSQLDIPNFVHFEQPTHHLDDYDIAIQALSMCKSDTVKLSQSDVAQLINDKWTWRDNFARTYNGLTNKSLS